MSKRPIVCLFVTLLVCSALPQAAAESESVPADRLVALVGALSDDRRSVHEPAMRGLIQIGEDVIPDLEVLAKDPSAQTRARVAVVATGIGGPQAFPLLARLSDDRDPYVREVAVLGLGDTDTERAYLILAPLLRDPLPGVRESAALALGRLDDLRAISDLTLWPEAGGARANLRLAGPPRDEQQLKRIQKAMQASLKHLVMRPSAMPVVVAELEALPDYRKVILLEMTWEIGDPRLSEPVADLLTSSNVDVRRAAATALAANGDGRAVEALCSVAASDSSPSVRDAAAATLRRLTGHQAGPGPAWQLWWRSHGGSVDALAERDRFIASLFAPEQAVAAADLAAFTPRQLMPIVDGVLGNGAPWWPRRAWQILQLDDPTRWTPVLHERYLADRDEADQVAMVVLLDALGDPAADPLLVAALDAVRDARSGPGLHGGGSLMLALMLAVEGGETRTLRAER